MTNYEKVIKRLPKVITNPKAWIGIDFDGTISKLTHPYTIGKVGEPIMPMIECMKELLKNGYNIKILTARVHSKNIHKQFEKNAIKNFLKHYVTDKNIEITSEKDYDTILIIDDIAIVVKDGVLK